MNRRIHGNIYIVRYRNQRRRIKQKLKKISNITHNQKVKYTWIAVKLPSIIFDILKRRDVSLSDFIRSTLTEFLNMNLNDELINDLYNTYLKILRKGKLKITTTRIPETLHYKMNEVIKQKPDLSQTKLIQLAVIWRLTKENLLELD